MTAPIGTAAKATSGSRECDSRNISKFKHLPTDFRALLGRSIPGELGLGSPSDCKLEMAHSQTGGAPDRPTAGREEMTSPREQPPAVDPLALSLATAPAAPLLAAERAVSVAPANGAPMTGASVLDAVLASEVLQRVAWGGDRRRGVARLELGGELSGAVVVVKGEGREVSLEVSLPEGLHAADLPERLAARLAARGLAVRELIVH